VTEEKTRVGNTSNWLTSFLLGVGAGTATDAGKTSAWLARTLRGVGGTTAEVGSVVADRAITASITSAAAALLTAWRLRALPPRPPILRYGVGLMLALSLVAAILGRAPLRRAVLPDP
jgi:hypothetical protein